MVMKLRIEIDFHRVLNTVLKNTAQQNRIEFIDKNSRKNRIDCGN